MSQWQVVNELEGLQLDGVVSIHVDVESVTVHVCGVVPRDAHARSCLLSNRYIDRCRVVHGDDADLRLVIRWKETQSEVFKAE